MGQQILLDSTVIIAALRETDVHHEDAKEIFMSSGKSSLAISAITLTESLIRPHALGAIHATRAESKIRGLIGTIFPFDSDAAVLSAKYVQLTKPRFPMQSLSLPQSRLKPPWCHLIVR